MLIPSPLATLVQVLADVCQQAQQHQALLSKNEAATRAALIDPILRALGWNTADVAMVEPERTVENKQVLDYVLKSKDGHPLVVVEAKKLGEVLDKAGHVGALVGYAITLKPRLVYITDGLNWDWYSPSHSHWDRVGTLHLSKETLLPAALQLLQLLDAAHGGHGLVAPKPAALLIPPAKKELAFKPSKPTLLAASKLYVPLTLSLALGATSKPVWLRLPNGSEHQLKTWKDILVAACKLVLSTRPDLPLPLPDKSGKKIALFSRQQPVNDVSFTSVNYQDLPLYIYTNYDASKCIANALHALTLLPKAQQQQEAAVAFGG